MLPCTENLAYGERPSSGTTCGMVRTTSRCLVLHSCKNSQRIKKQKIFILALFRDVYLIPLYQRERFIVVFDHDYDPLGRGWQQHRSMLALGSGGFFGQGYMQGTQTQSLSQEALPWRHTDFIFSVCGEELGLVGCLAIMLLLLAIIVRILIVARNAVTPFHCNICVGIAAMLMFQTIINIGMCLFVMPVIGITLPFFSYGGSSLLTLFAAMGLVAGIKMRSTSTIRRPPPNILR